MSLSAESVSATRLPTHPVKRVAVVVGSSRPGRICPGIAAWIRDALEEAASNHKDQIRFELVDLAEVDLPFLNERLIPALDQYEHEHTKAWSATVSGYDGFVFVFPQYNWGYPALLKNALDFLYHEWADKPASFATYGTRWGGRAAKQFQGVLAGLDMRELYHHLEVVITIHDVDSDWQVKGHDAVLGQYSRKLTAVASEMLVALRVAGAHDPTVTRPFRALALQWRRARILGGGARLLRLRRRSRSTRRRADNEATTDPSGVSPTHPTALEMKHD